LRCSPPISWRGASAGVFPAIDAMLEVDIEHRLAAFELDVHFRSGRGLTALFGRSGAGKSSIVNAIAGLIRPERGRIVVDGSVLVDTERGIRAPTHRRRVGYVFQEGRLFPHLTVRQNLLFGRWFATGSPPSAGLDDVVDLLGIAPLLDRRPGRLSGGEKQRVAIGRALLASPRLLLMDEPLASLDARRKDEILPYIERLRDQASVPIVYVSHSVAEVTRLATTIVLISEGRVRAVGPVQEVMGRAELYPLTGRFEAGAVLGVRVAAHDTRWTLTELTGSFGKLLVPRLDTPVGTALRVRIRARDVILATAAPIAISALNVLAGRVERLVPIEEGALEVQLRLGDERLLARVTRRSGEALGLTPGRQVYAVIKTVAIDRRSLSRQGENADLDEVELFDS
jgi:molybdate transport system ATP-binding protein